MITFDCEYTVGEKGLTIVTYFWEVGDELDPVGSTVRYEMRKLCTGSVEDNTRR